MTIPKDELLEVMKNAGSYEYSGGSHLVGINMEGPFISPAKKGAQAAENIMHCDYEYFSQLQKAANGLIKLVDIAPEEPGAMEFIDRAKGEVSFHWRIQLPTMIQQGKPLNMEHRMRHIYIMQCRR